MSTGCAKCLAISFAKQSHVPPCAMNIFDLFMSFKYINITDQRNPWLSQAVQNCYLLGHFEPYVLLVGGSECHLQVVKLSWMRNQLKSPFGFSILTISDAGGLLMRRVPQYLAMRLEEVICQLLWQNTQTEPSCSMEKLMSCLRNVYRDLQPRPPSYEAVRAALSALVTAGAVYFSGQGYSLLTAEKLAVAKWLENVPEVMSLSEEEEDDVAAAAATTAEQSEEEERSETKKAPLAQLEPSCESYVAGRPDSSPTCNPYASTNLLNLRPDFVTDPNDDDCLDSPTMQLSNPAILCSMPSLEFPSSLELQRNGGARDKSDTWNPTVPVSPATRLREANARAITLSQPTVGPVDYAGRYSRYRAMTARSPRQTRRSKTSTRPDWSSPTLVANDTQNGQTNPAQTTGKPKAQPSFVRWITQQFQRLRSGWCRQRHPKESSLFGSVVDPHTPDSGISVPVHQKSRSVPISTDSSWNRSPHLEHRYPIAHAAGVPASTLTKTSDRARQSNLGSLRRCFSLAEDAKEGFSERPSVTHYEVPRGDLTHCNRPIPEHRSLMPAPVGQWISNQDLATSPSYLSLAARPISRLDRSSNERARLPSHSASRLVPPPADARSQPWPYFRGPQRHSVLATPTSAIQPSKQRPATRDSGFAESDCTNPPRPRHLERSVGFSISPLSKSSDGGLLGLDSQSALWLNASPQSGANVWWTTGFEHPVPSIMVSNTSLSKPMDQSIQSAHVIPYTLVGRQLVGR